jgi:hypothetical protein
MRRKRIRAGAVVLAAAGLLTWGLAGQSAANISPSTFEGNDGNLVVNTAGNIDWATLIDTNTRPAGASYSAGQDLPSGTGDNSFGNGSKEDSVDVTVGDGSIPNSKSDLARFAVGSQIINNKVFLYLAWSRENLSGTVNFDFELNKLAQPDLTTLGPKHLNRSIGDVLISYDFQGGSNTPTLTRRLWTGSQWGPEGLLSASFAEGQTNGSPVSENLLNPAVLRPAQQFGEASINLTDAGLIPPNACEGFTSAYVKGRSSSGGFTAALKDFIAPVPVTVTNCGILIVDKVTVPSGDPTAFPFTESGPNSYSKQYTLTDAQTPHQSIGLQVGTYSVSEAPVPANWVLTSSTCTGTGNTPASISIVAGGTVTCTFTNTLQLGTIKVTKTRKHAADGPGSHPESGVSFTVNGVTQQTGADGTTCFGSLPFATYTVHETVPAGESVAVNDQQVTVDNNTTCDTVPYAGESVTFANTPLTDITVSVNSQVDGGTASTMVCKDAANATVASGSTDAVGDGSATALSLAPGTYTCTVVIDP